MLTTGITAVAFAVAFGRWHPIPAEAYRPTLEVD
jgi:hypothetical protein